MKRGRHRGGVEAWAEAETNKRRMQTSERGPRGPRIASFGMRDPIWRYALTSPSTSLESSIARSFSFWRRRRCTVYFSQRSILSRLVTPTRKRYGAGAPSASPPGLINPSLHAM